METLRFDLKREEKEIVISDEPYVLKELDGTGRDTYLNTVINRVKVNKKGEPTGLKSFDAMQAGLVAQSLFKVVGNEHEPVNVATIQTWPAKVVSSLFDAAKELSGLGDEEGEEGNDEEEEGDDD